MKKAILSLFLIGYFCGVSFSAEDAQSVRLVALNEPVTSDTFTIATPDLAQFLPDVGQIIFAFITARYTNQGRIRLGPSTVGRTSWSLATGDTASFAIDNLQDIYMSVDNPSDGIEYFCLR